MKSGLPRASGSLLPFNRSSTVALYAIADQQAWLVGETLEHALAALQRELAGQGA